LVHRAARSRDEKERREREREREKETLKLDEGEMGRRQRRRKRKIWAPPPRESRIRRWTGEYQDIIHWGPDRPCL